MLQLSSSAKKLECPDCCCQMQLFSCGPTFLYRCASCKGIWFTKKSFAVFRHSLDKMPLKELALNVEALSPRLENISGCPSCKIALSTVKYSYNSKVLLGNCESCGGKWLSNFELRNFIEHVKILQLIANDVMHVKGELRKQRSSYLRDIGLAAFFRLLTKPVRIFKL